MSLLFSSFVVDPPKRGKIVWEQKSTTFGEGLYYTSMLPHHSVSFLSEIESIYSLKKEAGKKALQNCADFGKITHDK